MEAVEAKAVRSRKSQDANSAEDSVKKITDADLDRMAKTFGNSVKTMPKRTIKIPVIEGAEPVVPVIINGYPWYINRGERVEVPEIVAYELEQAGII